MGAVEKKQQGILILGGNHLGNPADIPPRCLVYAKEADLVIFEEDRVARQVLKHAGVHRSYLLFSEHKQTQTLDELKTALLEAKTVLYMSDQGMPNVADPGRELVRVARSLGAKISVISGPSSVTAAVAIASFVEGPFLFRGFLSREKEDRQKELRDIAKSLVPVVVMDTPYRLFALIDDVVACLPRERKVMLALDISGESEDFIETSCGDLMAALKRRVDISQKNKLNFVLVIDR